MIAIAIMDDLGPSRAVQPENDRTRQGLPGISGNEGEVEMAGKFPIVWRTPLQSHKFVVLHK